MSRAHVKDKRKAELIAAALESIAKRGLQETTITHIARGAGMSRGIVNFYFTSKEMMLRETLKTLIDDYEAELTEAQGKATDDTRLSALIAVHFGKKLCSARRLNVMSAFWGHAATHASYRHQLEAADSKIETALTAALAHALGCSLDEARHDATQLHALIRGLWLNFMLNPQKIEREALLRECTRFIDRLTGAPVRIVRNAQAAAQAAAKPLEHTAKSKSKSTPKEPQQLDIEDLFGGL